MQAGLKCSKQMSSVVVSQQRIMGELIGSVERGHLGRDLRHKAFLFITRSLPCVFSFLTLGSKEIGGLNLSSCVCVCGCALIA